MEQKWSLIDILNPIKHLKLYEQERKKAASAEVLEKFDQLLKTHQPKSLVCHSMGAKLLANYLDQYTLPEFIKSLILIQADIPSKQTLQKENQRKVAVYNLYCPWDPTLLLSIPYNLYLPAGIVGLKQATKNIYLPLTGSHHLHVASIRNKNITKILEAL